MPALAPGAVTLHVEWGLWIVSLCGAAAVEAVVALSARERKTVSRRVGRWMLAARMLLIVAALLIYEHSLIRPNDLSKVNLAFFNVNGYISITIFVATLLALTLPR